MPSTTCTIDGDQRDGLTNWCAITWALSAIYGSRSASAPARPLRIVSSAKAPSSKRTRAFPRRMDKDYPSPSAG